MDNNLYLISGDDQYEKEKYIEKIKLSFPEIMKGINCVYIDKDTINTLESEISTCPFGCDKKLIIVRIPKRNQNDETNSDNSKSTEWLSDELLDMLNGTLEGVCVVFVEEGISKGKLYKIISSNGKHIICNEEKGVNLSDWIIEMLNKYNKLISKLNATHMIDLCGTSKQNLTNELMKLIDYKDNVKEITRDDIDKLCIKNSDIIIFDLTDGLGSKNIKKSLKSLDELLENKEPIQKIIIMIARHFKNLLMVKEVLRQKKNIMTELNMKRYPAMKYEEQSRKFTDKEIIYIINQLAQLDIDSKLGKMDLRIGLEKLICSV